jgi:hypothetical protein
MDVGSIVVIQGMNKGNFDNYLNQTNEDFTIPNLELILKYNKDFIGFYKINKTNSEEEDFLGLEKLGNDFVPPNKVLLGKIVHPGDKESLKSFADKIAIVNFEGADPYRWSLQKTSGGLYKKAYEGFKYVLVPKPVKSIFEDAVKSTKQMISKSQ